jgi:hypothetical protein
MDPSETARYTADPEFTLGQIRVQTTRGYDFFHAEAETTMEHLQTTIGAVMGTLDAARREGQVAIAGPLIIIYLEGGAKEGEAKEGEDAGPFVLQAGYPVEPGTEAVGGARVRHVDDFRCCSVIYTGGLQHIMSAYQAIEAGMKDKGLTASGESREIYLYFEADDSANNITLIQMGLAA